MTGAIQHKINNQNILLFYCNILYMNPVIGLLIINIVELAIWTYPWVEHVYTVKYDGEVEETIDDILKNATERESAVENFIGNPSPETHSDEVREAITAAIEEEVDEDEIRRNPTLRVVLRKGLGYSLPDDDRNYEIIDEQVSEREVRRRSRW